jgi:hypothetical protein
MGVRRKTALLLTAAALVGCGESEEPTAALPRVTAVAIAAPDRARADTPSGAAAFVRFFYAQVTSAYATGQSTALRELSLPSCRVCLRYADSVDDMRAQRQRATPVRFVFRFVESPADDDAATARVDVQFDAPASSRYAADGALVFAEQAMFRIGRTVTLRRVGRGWKVASIG